MIPIFAKSFSGRVSKRSFQVTQKLEKRFCATINATVGFGTLGKAIDIDPKSLMRMLGPSGNPKTDNFVEIIKYLQTREGVHLKVEEAIA